MQGAAGSLAAGAGLVGLLGLAGCDLGEPPTAYAVPGATVLAGDVDGDGDVDLVTSDEAGIGVLVGDGAGGFTVTTVPHVTRCDQPGPEATCSDVAVRQVVDVDDDGRHDLVVSHRYREDFPGGVDTTLYGVRLADGAGGFGEPNGMPPGSVVDATGDGLVDVVAFSDPFSGGLPVRLSVRPGDGTTIFGAPVTTDLPGDHVVPGANPVGDLDGDGDADMVVDGVCLGGSGGRQIRACADVFLGDGSGAFTPAARLAFANPDAAGVLATLGDLDGDGHLDIAGATTGDRSTGDAMVATMSFFHGDGAGGFGPEVTRPAPAETTGVQLADFDGDGHVDLLIDTDDRDSETTDDFGWVLFGDGAGQYGDNRSLPSGRGVVADLDGDEHPDFATFRVPGDLRVFLNRLEA